MKKQPVRSSDVIYIVVSLIDYRSRACLLCFVVGSLMPKRFFREVTTFVGAAPSPHGVPRAADVWTWSAGSEPHASHPPLAWIDPHASHPLHPALEPWVAALWVALA